MARTILVADASPTIRRVVELTLSEAGYHVESVASGDAALERLKDLRPDVVLADVRMPEPTGYEVCRRVKASQRPAPVLLLAGAFDGFDAAEARACGADGHLVEPFDSRTLLERIAALLDRPAGAEGARVASVESETEQAPKRRWSEEETDEIVQRVVEQLSGTVREVVDRVVRERIRELETEE